MRGWKKDLLLLATVIIVAAVIAVAGGRIRSVDEYYGDTTTTTAGGVGTVTISIRCDTLLAHYNELDAALQSEEFVPSDGCILPETVYTLQEGDTVFDVLQRAAKDHRIQLDAQNSFDGVYVQGIHHLYEFSCGSLSGWVFKVNGTGSSSSSADRILQNGDVIEWLYTCDLGRDVGCGPADGEGA